MTEDMKKGLVIAGGLGIIALAVWYSKSAAVGSTVANPVGPPATDATTYNVPPYN